MLVFLISVAKEAQEEGTVAPVYTICSVSDYRSLQWRHNGHDSVPKTPASRLLTQLFIQTQIEGNIKAPRHWPLWGNSPGTGEFRAQMASYAENVSIWLRRHVV